MPPKVKLKGKVSKDRISDLPDALLVHILCLLPTKQAVTTLILSKRWQFLWTLMPKLNYSETSETKKSVWNFLDRSMQLHRAPSLESLCIQLDNDYPFDADVEKWVTNAVERCVRELILRFPRGQIVPLPDCLYTSKTLVELTLSDNIIVDVPSQPSLPSLQSLTLASVLYKDQDSHVKLISSCPVLKHLDVYRAWHDNVTSFIVKVPSLERLKYMNDIFDGGGSLFIDSPALNHLDIFTTHNCSIQNMPCLDVADLRVNVGSSQNDNFLTSFSSVISLNLTLSKVVAKYCSASNFSRLIELKLTPNYRVSYTLEAVMLLLHNAPKLKVLMIDSFYNVRKLSWNQPSSVPVCLLSHLEIFEWKSYLGIREENEMVTYILGNSNCLKTVGISPSTCYSRTERHKMEEELKSMYRSSSSSQLLFSAQLNWRYRK